MRYLGPLIALMAFGVAGYVLWGAKVQYDNTPAEQKGFPPALVAALNQAGTEKKNVMAMFTASWCGPCHRMRSEVLPSSVVQAQAQHFVWVFLDGDDSGNEKAMQQFDVGAYPTFCILDNKGHLLHKVVGGRDPQTFADILAKY